MCRRLRHACLFARIALALRLALVAMILAAAGLPAMPGAVAETHCAIAKDNPFADENPASAPDAKSAAGCAFACPMHLAIMPSTVVAVGVQAPEPLASASQRALYGRAPPSPERPPRLASA